VAERRKSWDAADTHSTPRSRFAAQRIALETRLAALYEEHIDPEEIRRLYASVREVLGYATGEFRVTPR
jgi:hypothetical protein